MQAETVWLMMVARATPATLMEKGMTNTRFSTTLMEARHGQTEQRPPGVAHGAQEGRAEAVQQWSWAYR